MGASGGLYGDKYPWLMHTIYADSGGKCPGCVWASRGYVRAIGA